MTNKIKYSFLVSGGFEYEGKIIAFNKAKENSSFKATVLNKNGKLICSIENKEFGEISSKITGDYTPFQQLLQAIPEKRTVTILGKIGSKLAGEFEISEKDTGGKLETVKSITNRLISEGIATEEEIDERLIYLKEAAISEKQIICIFATYKTYPDKIKSKIPSTPETLFVDNGNLLQRVISYININNNMLFEGERGVGKNVLAETAAWLYKRPLYEFSLNSQHDNNSLLGGKTFDEGVETREESLNFFQSAAKFFKAGISLKSLFKEEPDDEEKLSVVSFFKKIGTLLFGTKHIKFEINSVIEAAEYGGILVFDEFNTAVGNVMSLFNSMLDDRRRIDVPGYKKVICDDNFLVIATQNKDYQSTFANNEATVDRFVKIVFPPLEDITKILVAKVPDVNEETLSKCGMIFGLIRNCIKDGTINEKTMSIRGFITVVRVVTFQDLPLKIALEDNVANKADDDVEIKALKEIIDEVL